MNFRREQLTNPQKYGPGYRKGAFDPQVFSETAFDVGGQPEGQQTIAPENPPPVKQLDAAHAAEEGLGRLIIGALLVCVVISWAWATRQ
jgi:hypothetical protein